MKTALFGGVLPMVEVCTYKKYPIVYLTLWIPFLSVGWVM